MPLTLVLGPANSAKAGEVLGAYSAAARRDALLVVPTGADAVHYDRELAAHGVTLGRALTFDGLLGEIALRAGYDRPVLSPLRRELLIRRAVAGLELETLGESAATPGFAAAVGGFLATLGAQRVSPGRLIAALRAWNDDPYSRDLAAIYRRYAAGLERAGAEDAESHAWGALDALRAAPTRWRDTPVFFYGFDDLTRVEQDAVETLAGPVGAEITVSLTYEPGRLALAARAGAVEGLRAQARTVRELDALDTYYSAPQLHHLERHIFEPDPPRIDAGAAVQILEAGGTRAEAELVAAEVLAALAAGVAPEDVVVITRSLRRCGALLESTLLAYGVPATSSRRVPFTHTGLGRGVAAALDGDALAYLRLSADPAEVDRLEANARREGTTVRAALPNLAGAVDALLPRPDGRTLTREQQLDVRAAAALEAALAELGQLSRSETRELLDRLEVPASQPGGVLVAEPLAIRARRFARVFVTGLCEGEFPATDPPDPFLGEDRRRELALASGLTLEPPPDPVARERYLLYACISRAKQAITFSHRSSDEDGNAVAASPFLDDILGLFNEIPRRRRLLADVIWAPEEAPTRREFALAAAGVNVNTPPPGNVAETRRLGAAALGHVRHVERVSPGAIEKFANCPVAWLVERQLDPEELEPEAEALVKGSLIHEVLHQVMDGHPEVLEQLQAPDDLAPGRPPAVRAAILAGIVAELRRYLTDAAARPAPGFAPQLLEFSFDVELADGLAVTGVIDRSRHRREGPRDRGRLQERSRPDGARGRTLGYRQHLPGGPVHARRATAARTGPGRRGVPAAGRQGPASARGGPGGHRAQAAQQRRVRAAGAGGPARRGGGGGQPPRRGVASRGADALSRDVLARRLPAPGHLLGRALMDFTPEQLAAIERRSGRLLLDAGAGSGKTSVLVERYARAVEVDGVEPGAILAITFTEKAAAEMRQRVRARLGLNEDPGWILTIHGFCARVLRAHALSVGLDPQFGVLEEDVARELSELAFDGALAAVAETPDGAELIASQRISELRGAVMASYRELRSRGERRPRLPVVANRTVATTAAHVRELGTAVMRELGELPDPGITVQRAINALASTDFDTDWPGDLPDLGNGAGALKTDACERYREALAGLREQLADAIALRMRNALDALLVGYGQAYEAAKAARGGVDFDDLELLARDVLAGGARYAFAHVMVDELQDTNAVQLELVDLVAGEAAVFMVGDAQQSIYGFRHADVSLFRARGQALGAEGARLALATNFRTRAEILNVLNRGFEGLLEDFMALAPGRVDAPVSQPLVELLIADKTAKWERDEGLATPWRAAEARALAARVATLVAAGECRPADVVVLTRATTDLRVYERALEAAGVPTFVVGGRGYWNHPQVVDLVAYLRALANPREQESYWTVLVSPLCGLSLDGLVLVAAGAFDELDLEDAGRLARFEAFFAAERRAALRVAPERLIDRALEWSGYDLALAGMSDGRRRLANVRKLMRLAREWEGAHGPDLAGFVELLGRRGGGGAREAEAPIESEALDAVRLMTIHRSKGLEFPVVCVADLGRGPTWDGGLIRLGSGGRLGLKISRPGVGVRVEALAYRELREEAVARDRAEQRRLFYVAMTRAQERLILSGAARLEKPPRPDSLTPIDWIGPAFRLLDGVAVSELVEDAAMREVIPMEPKSASLAGLVAPEEPRLAPVSAVDSLSYSGLALYERCAYRFYAERVLGLAPVAGPSTGARARGVEIHAQLAQGDYAGFDWNETFARVRAARDLRNEQGFAFVLAGVLLTGVFDAIASESERLLVVDYKSDALRGRRPEDIVGEEYAVQRLIYGLAALRTGAARVEVVHLFLEDVGEPAAVVYEAGQREELESALAGRIAPVIAGSFEVTDEPHRGICAGCPAAASMCPVPEALRTRTAPTRSPSPAR